MPRARVGRRRDQRCWLEIPAVRHRLIEPARELPGFTDQRTAGQRDRPTHRFSAVMEIEGYESRKVTVGFSLRHWWDPKVSADGPEDSPHRYLTPGGRQRLCLWHPGDPVDRIWQPEDGLLTLFGMASVHLFKEAWWRDHGEWIGEEYPHGIPAEEKVGDR